jgi:hypothetical protein
MATVQDILQADSFAGNANLGGANAPAIQIDTKPLQQLALYTQFYNKTLYDQAVKDRDAKIREVADVAKIDLNNVWGKDKDEMANDLNNLKIKAAEYAKKDTRSVQDELDWQTSIGDVMNKYNSAKQRAASYQTQLNDINSDPTRTSAQKDVLLKALNDKFDKTDISTPVSAATGYKPVNINLPAPVTSTVSAIKISADKNLATSNDISFFNPLASAPVAMNAINGVNSLMNNVSGVDKDLQATSNGEAQTWAGMKDALNSVIASKGADGKFKYFDDNNKFLYDKFKQDNASNTAIMQPVDAMMALTNYSQQHQNELKAGQFSDEGVNYNAPSTLSPDTFAAGVINITPDGVQANQLALAGMYAKYTGDKNEKKVTKLGLGIEQQNANANTSRAALGWKELDLNKDKWAATQKVGTDAMKNTALDKAKRIYNEMAALADKNGVISPDKVRQLNVEQLKYLGVEQPTEVNNNGVKTQVSGFKPLTFDKDKQYAIQLKNGQIKVLEGDKITQAESGSYKGGNFNPSMSTNITNIATNVLNEQVKNSTGKEIGAYSTVNEASNREEQPVFSQPTKKTISSKDIHTKAAAAGYSDAEYKKILIKNGIKITE